MSRKRKPAKAAPIKLIWLEQIIEHEWPDKPARPTIFAVAATLVTYGDRAGRGICPAVQTIAAPMRVKRQTVIDVLSLMVAEGVLVRRGKTHYGTNIYDMKIAAKATDTDAEAVPQAVPRAVTPRGTQSSSLDRKGERDDDYSPTAAAEAAAAGIDTETDEAEAEITAFIAAFTPIFAARPRGSKVPTAALQPSHRGLRTAIITKITAGWPRDHLIERTLIDITANETKIGNLSSVVASILNRLPAEPDATARKAIEAGKVAAEAKKKRETDKAAKKAKAEKERIASEKRRILDALDAEMLKLENAAHKLYGLQAGDEIIKTFYADIGITNLDADFEALDNTTLANYTSRCRTKAAELQASVKRAEQDALKALDDAEAYCRQTYLDRYRAWHEVETDINTTLAEHGINRDTMRDHHNIATATRLYRELGDKMATLPKPTTEKKVEMW